MNIDESRGEETRKAEHHETSIWRIQEDAWEDGCEKREEFKDEGSCWDENEELSLLIMEGVFREKSNLQEVK